MIGAEMSEYEMWVQVDGNRVELTHENTTLYTFLGTTAVQGHEFDNASVDHAFVQLDDSNGTTRTGAYIFRLTNPLYERVAEYATERRFPAILNMREVPECDLAAFKFEVDKTTAQFSKELPDEFAGF